jgi:hypothetical protein
VRARQAYLPSSAPPLRQTQYQFLHPHTHTHTPHHTYTGQLNHERLQVLLGALADDELTTLEERAAVSG